MREYDARIVMTGCHDCSLILMNELSNAPPSSTNNLHQDMHISEYVKCIILEMHYLVESSTSELKVSPMNYFDVGRVKTISAILPTYHR